MRKIVWKSLSEIERHAILRRPASKISANVQQTINEILDDVQVRGDDAVRDYTQKFDHYDPLPFFVPSTVIDTAGVQLPAELRTAIDIAYSDISRFHAAQGYRPYEIETAPGMACARLVTAIDSVGLYVPGGTAPLFSTALMLGVPSQIAGNSQRLLCTPADRDGNIHPAILYAAKLCGIERIARIGGAQAIGAMAFGTQSIAPVAKIFGPGNLYVTAAKSTVARETGGPAIDMPAGPSEVLIIIDAKTPSAFVAADLLSQAEHDPASQVVLITIAEQQIDTVLRELEKQLISLPRAPIIRQALANSLAIVVDTVDEAIMISNLYAPEHLILCFDDAARYQSAIKNAGSVFCGLMTPESLGDYASGTNHVLPTAGATRGYSGLSVEAFQKTISWQQATFLAVQEIGQHVVTMARAEGLEAHARSILAREEVDR